jgi:hypothetical protein
MPDPALAVPHLEDTHRCPQIEHVSLEVLIRDQSKNYGMVNQNTYELEKGMNIHLVEAKLS